MNNKVTVALPDGKTASRRTPRSYTHAIATRLDAARPDRDRDKYSYAVCAEGQALMAPFEAETEKAALGATWHAFYTEMDSRRQPVRAAHKATCSLGCNGAGEIRSEVSRTPEPTGWSVTSWHHSRALAEKALASRSYAWTKGMDEVRILEVAQ